MSDTNMENEAAAGEASVATTYVKAMKPSSLGTPRAPDPAAGETEVVLGAFVGEVNGCREYLTKDKNDNEIVAYPLSGMFRGYRADGQILHSNTLYLPGGFHEALVDAVTEPEFKADADGVMKPTGRLIYNGARVKITYVIKTVPSTSKAGYAYKIESVESIDAVKENPIDSMLNKHGSLLAKLMPALASKVPSLALAAPTEEAKGGRKK